MMKLMGNIAELRKGLINTYHINWNPQFILKYKTVQAKSSGFVTRSMSTDKTVKPTTSVVQQTIDEANREESAPSMPDPASCCGEGCQNCVWLKYVYKVNFYYNHDMEHIKAALSQIPCGDTRAFVEYEMKKTVLKRK